jgi:6-phosphogluconate dehydrogenase
MVGLGRMGGNMARRLLRDGHGVTVFDPNPDAVAELEIQGASGARSLNEVAEQLATPRTVWVMVPSGRITEETVTLLGKLLEQGDTVIDGGNSNYKESIRRSEMLATHGIDYLDCGTSGGVWGLDNGYCLTIGGSQAAYERNRPIFKTLAPEENDGGLYLGPSGSGHYVKMIHNGVEYGLMQAYAEGFELLAAKEEFGLDLGSIAQNWRYGSVIRSWLLDLTADEFADDPALEKHTSYVDDSGEGRWTVDASVELAVPAPVIALALQMRFRSRQENPLGGRALAAMRNAFGGRSVRKSDD